MQPRRLKALFAPELKSALPNWAAIKPTGLLVGTMQKKRRTNFLAQACGDATGTARINKVCLLLFVHKKESFPPPPPRIAAQTKPPAPRQQEIFCPARLPLPLA
jgi:hypothetical protein